MCLVLTCYCNEHSSSSSTTLPQFPAFPYPGGKQIFLYPVIVCLWVWVWGWGGVGVFWWLASLIILLLKVWFTFTEIKVFCSLDYFFLVSNILESLNERRILMSFYTTRLPRALCFVGDVQVFILQFYLPGYNSLLDFIPVWIPLQRISSLFYVHVSHNCLGYTSFFPSVPSSYMYFLTVFFCILQSPIFTALVFLVINSWKTCVLHSVTRSTSSAAHKLGRESTGILFP